MISVKCGVGPCGDLQENLFNGGTDGCHHLSVFHWFFLTETNRGNEDIEVFCVNPNNFWQHIRDFPFSKDLSKCCLWS